MAGDAGGCCGDAVPGGQDGGGGLGARVGAGPAGRVGQAAGGGDAVPGAGDPGDRVGFGFAQPGAAGGGGPGRVAGVVVQEHVAELVRQRPYRLLIADLRRDADAADGPEDGAVGRRPVFCLDRVSLDGGPASTARPVPGRADQRGGRAAASLTRRPGGLGQVPEVGDPVGVSPGRPGLVVVFAGVLCAARRGRDGEDRDPVLALADLPSGRGPLPVVRAPGWRRAAGRG